uniref:Uncharacterized protein n=1 Tax=Anopheles epiroticus TaxID=199890 RepID=A0A182PLC6_9DIPT
MVTLNGSISLLVTLNKSHEISTDFFHSNLGNQQFNHYPVKLQTRDVCDFVDNFHDDYSQFVNDIINFPKKGKCPIEPRTVYVIDKPFPNKAIPTFFPSGLWKVYVMQKMDDVEVARFEIITKFKNNY